MTASNETIYIKTLFYRMNRLIKSREFQRASLLCDHILEISPQNPKALMGKLYSKYGILKNDSKTLCTLPLKESIKDEPSVSLICNALSEDDKNEFLADLEDAENMRISLLEEIKKSSGCNILFCCREELSKELEPLIRSLETEDYFMETSSSLSSSYPKLYSALSSARILFVYGKEYADFADPSVSILTAMYENLTKNEPSSHIFTCTLEDLQDLSAIKDKIADLLPSPRQLYQKGIRFLEIGSWEKVFPVVEELLRDNPSYAKAYLLMGLAREKVTEISHINDHNNTEIFFKNFQDTIALEPSCLQEEDKDLLFDLKLQIERTIPVPKVKPISESYVRHLAQQVKITKNACLFSGYTSLYVLLPDGTCHNAFQFSSHLPDDSWDHLVSLCLEDDFTVGLRDDGTLVTRFHPVFDTSEFGRCKVKDWKDIKAIATSSCYTAGLKKDGTVLITGVSSAAHDETLADWKNITAIAAGKDFLAGLKNDGHVLLAGYFPEADQVLDNWEHIVEIEAGGHHLIGLKADGTVLSAGKNIFGQCNTASWKNILSIATSGSMTAGLRVDGTILLAGNTDKVNYILKKIKDWENVVSITLSSDFIAGLTADGKILVAFGNPSDEKRYKLYYSEHFRLFDNLDTLEEERSRKIKDRDYIRQKHTSDFISSCVFAEKGFTGAITSDDRILTAGPDLPEQAVISFWKDARCLTFKDSYTLGISQWNDSYLYTDRCPRSIRKHLADYFPRPTYDREINESYKNKDILSASQGNDFTVYLKTDGTAFAEGKNDHGQCNVSDWTDLVALVAGYDHTVGVKKDGTLLATGNNDRGQCEVSHWKLFEDLHTYSEDLEKARKEFYSLYKQRKSEGACPYCGNKTFKSSLFSPKQCTKCENFQK